MASTSSAVDPVAECAHLNSPGPDAVFSFACGMAPALPPDDAVEFRQASLPMLAVLVKTPDLRSIATALARHFPMPAPGGLEAVVLDLTPLDQQAGPLDLAGLAALLRSHGMNPVGARARSTRHLARAGEAGLFFSFDLA